MSNRFTKFQIILEEEKYEDDPDTIIFQDVDDEKFNFITGEVIKMRGAGRLNTSSKEEVLSFMKKLNFDKYKELVTDTVSDFNDPKEVKIYFDNWEFYEYVFPQLIKIYEKIFNNIRRIKNLNDFYLLKF